RRHRPAGQPRRRRLRPPPRHRRPSRARRGRRRRVPERRARGRRTARAARPRPLRRRRLRRRHGHRPDGVRHRRPADRPPRGGVPAGHPAAADRAGHRPGRGRRGARCPTMTFMTTARSSLTPAAQAPGLRERKKIKTRRAIRAAMYALVEEQGYEATTVEQIAERADVSPSTVFRYFPTKEDILLTDE